MLPAAVSRKGVSAYHRHTADNTAKPLQFADIIVEEFRPRGKTEYNTVFEPCSSELTSQAQSRISGILSSLNRQWDVAWPQIHT